MTKICLRIYWVENVYVLSEIDQVTIADPKSQIGAQSVSFRSAKHKCAKPRRIMMGLEGQARKLSPSKFILAPFVLILCPPP